MVTALNRWVDEPFRLFFPLAVVTGILGVSMWPLYFFELIPFYPGMNHSRVMAFGFFGGFMTGFLWTALPRLVEAPILRRWELGLLTLSYLSVTVAHLLGNVVIGELAVLGWVVSMIGLFLPRLWKGNDIPPPGFILVLMGMVCAAVAASVSLIEARQEVAPEWLLWRQLLAFQGFLFLPVTGVAGFLLPRILGLTERQDFAVTRRPGGAWWFQFWVALAVGVVVVVSFLLEVRGYFSLAYGTRFIAILSYMTWQVPWYRAVVKGTFVWGLQAGVGSLMAGLLFCAIFPEWKIPFLHWSLGIGLVMITLVVACRVVWGHSGRLSRMEGRQRWFAWLFGVIVVAVTSRMIGDFLPRILISHYNYGAAFWALGVGWWGWRVLRVPADS